MHHHDLKFDNIVRGEDGVLRTLIDFSLSSTGVECEYVTCPDLASLNARELGD